MPTQYTPSLVSVIIPAFNSAKFLPQAIESVLGQSYSKVELIVVNDGSTDNTEEVIGPYRNKLLHFYKENGGPGNARNFGVVKSHGEYIAFLDADDYWLPEKLYDQVEYFALNPELKIVHTNAWIMEETKTICPVFLNYKPPSGKIFEELFLKNRINLLTVMVKRECFNVIKGFDESRELIGLEDYELWLRMSLKFKIGYLDRILAVYRLHDNNISNEKRLVRSNLFLIEKFSHLFGSENYNYNRLISEKKKLLYYRWACNLIENKKYKDAKNKFLHSFNGPGVRIVSIIGLISCLLRTNIFMRSRAASIKFANIGEYLMSIKNYGDAKGQFLKSIKMYPLQKRSFRQLIKLIFENTKLKLGY